MHPKKRAGKPEKRVVFAFERGFETKICGVWRESSKAWEKCGRLARPREVFCAEFLAQKAFLGVDDALVIKPKREAKTQRKEPIAKQ